MARTYGQVKAESLKLIDEFSSRGIVQSASKIADYNLKIQSLTNAYTSELASTNARLPAVSLIAHAPIRNTLSDDTSSIKQYLPGTDFSITLTNAQACFFETTYPGQIIIEQSGDNGATYTTIETINVPSTAVSFVEYRRLISPSLPTNIIRLRFTGSFIYFFRNYILYAYTWPTEAMIQQSRPFFEYALPSDFLALNFIYAKKDSRQLIPYNNAIITPDNKKICVNRYDAPLELQIDYWRRPTLLTFTGVDATDEAQIIDLADDAAIILPWFIAGDILNSEQLLAQGTLRLNQAAAKSGSLITNKSSDTTEILNVTGW